MANAVSGRPSGRGQHRGRSGCRGCCRIIPSGSLNQTPAACGGRFSKQKIQEDITMAFTAADVKKLREMTNVGMMDCKKALSENDGDMDKAIEWLRERAWRRPPRSPAASLPRAWLTPPSRTASASSSRSMPRPTSLQDPAVRRFRQGYRQGRRCGRSRRHRGPEELQLPGSELTVGEMIPEKVMVIGENIRSAALPASRRTSASLTSMRAARSASSSTSRSPAASTRP